MGLTCAVDINLSPSAVDHGLMKAWGHFLHSHRFRMTCNAPSRPTVVWRPWKVANGGCVDVLDCVVHEVALNSQNVVLILSAAPENPLPLGTSSSGKANGRRPSARLLNVVAVPDQVSLELQLL
jgi:hypothetical protein